MCQWQVEHPIEEFVRLTALGDDLKIVYARSDGDVQLLCEHHSREFKAYLLSSRSLGEEIMISCEHDPLQLRRSIQKIVILPLCCFILLRRQHINSAFP